MKRQVHFSARGTERAFHCILKVFSKEFSTMATPNEINTLIHALHEEREGLRAFAVEKLATIGSEAVPRLILALHAGDPDQEAAAAALCMMGSVAVPFL